MITANEARKITDDSAHQVALNEAVAIQLGEVERAIKLKAQNGGSLIIYSTIHLDSGVEHLISALGRYGYKVSHNESSIRISW